MNYEDSIPRTRLDPNPLAAASLKLYHKNVTSVLAFLHEQLLTAERMRPGNRAAHDALLPAMDFLERIQKAAGGALKPAAVKS